MACGPPPGVYSTRPSCRRRCRVMIRKIERCWSELVEEVLADPKLTEAEAEFLETFPTYLRQPKMCSLWPPKSWSGRYSAGVGLSR